VRLPFVGASYFFVPPLSRSKYVPPLCRRYQSGLYKVGEMLQYTNRGLGVMYTRVRLTAGPRSRS
jgi:hypothetical protein